MSLFCLIFQTDTILYLTVSKAELPDVPLERLKASNVCMSVCLYVDLRMCAMYVHLLQKENTVDSIKSIESFMVLDFFGGVEVYHISCIPWHHICLLHDICKMYVCTCLSECQNL